MWIEDFVVLSLLQHASEKQLKMIIYKSWIVMSNVPALSLFCFIEMVAQVSNPGTHYVVQTELFFSFHSFYFFKKYPHLARSGTSL